MDAATALSSIHSPSTQLRRVEVLFIGMVTPRLTQSSVLGHEWIRATDTSIFKLVIASKVVQQPISIQLNPEKKKNTTTMSARFSKSFAHVFIIELKIQDQAVISSPTAKEVIALRGRTKRDISIEQYVMLRILHKMK